MSTPDAAAALAPVAMELGRSGSQVKSLAIRTPTLDDVFREMTHSPRRSEDRRRGSAMTSEVRTSGFWRDIATVAGRALRQIPREPIAILPAVFVPAFFYAVNLGALGIIERTTAGYSFKAFLLPMAIAFAVTGMSRAPALVTDIQGGYFDRLCMTPIRRPALLLGLMVADVAVIIALCIPVLAIGFGVGVRFATGGLGVLAFVGFSALWGLVFTGLPYAVALQNGQPGCRERLLRHLLPDVLPERRRRAQAVPDRLVLDHRHLQPSHLPPERAAVTDRHWLGGRGRSGGIGGAGRDRRSSA